MTTIEINDSYYCSECGKYFFAPHYCVGKSSNAEPYRYVEYTDLKLVESEDILTRALKDYLKTYIEQSDKKTLEKLVNMIRKETNEN